MKMLLCQLRKYSLSRSLLLIAGFLAVLTLSLSAAAPVPLSGAAGWRLIQAPALPVLATAGGDVWDIFSEKQFQRELQEAGPAAGAANLPGLSDFIRQVNTGAPAVRGVFADGVLALRVVEQPADDPMYINGASDTATLFNLAARNNVTGLVAHNYLAGEQFYRLKLNTPLTIVYGDGRTASYTIRAIHRFQALQPESPYSDFVALADDEQLTAAELFNRMYSGGPKVTLQTCIEKDGLLSWGRYFVIAEPTVTP